jgi:hypothetical protein
MSARIPNLAVCGLLAIALLTACTGSSAPSHRESGNRAATNHPASSSQSREPLPLTSSAKSQCPKTTIRRAIQPPGSTGGGALSPGTSVYGNGKLFVDLNMNGVLVVPSDMVRPDGTIWWKFPWWRLIRGDLTVTGHRLDAPSTPLVPYVPAGYGDIGFQASGVYFPSEGCWQITGTVARSSVTFVALVIKKPHGG